MLQFLLGLAYHMIRMRFVCLRVNVVFHVKERDILKISERNRGNASILKARRGGCIVTFCVGSSLFFWNGQDALVHFGEGSGINTSAFDRDAISLSSHLTGLPHSAVRLNVELRENARKKCDSQVNDFAKCAKEV